MKWFIGRRVVPAMLLVLWFVHPAFAAEQTIAVLAASDSGVPVIELATATLSQNDAIALVERQRIESILHEQKLTVLGDRSDALRLGRLLDTEIFAVWDQATQANRGRLVVFDTTRGIRLEDKTLSASTQQKLAEQVAQAIEAATTKQQAAELQQLYLISITGYRNVDVPPELQPQLESIFQKFQQQLTSHPEIAVLERERLRLLLQEDALPIARLQARTLLSASTATLEFSRISELSTKVLVSIKHPNLAELQQVSLQVQNVVDSTSEATDKVAIALVAAIAAGLPERSTIAAQSTTQEEEAKILFEEGVRLSHPSQVYDAAVRLEAAYMLSPQLTTLERLFHAIGQIIHLETMKHTSRGAGSRVPTAEKLSTDEWLEVVRLGYYQMQIQRLIHEHVKALPNWPIRVSPGPRDYWLTRDFVLGFTLTRAVLEIDAQRQPEAFAAVRDYLAAGDRMIFEEFTRDVPGQLNEADLKRFNQHLQLLKFKRLFSYDVRYFRENWHDEFASLLKDNLKDGACSLSPLTFTKEFDTLPVQTADDIVAYTRAMKPQTNSALRFFVEYADLHRRIDWNVRTQNEVVLRDLDALIVRLRSVVAGTNEAATEKQSVIDAGPIAASSITVSQPRYELGELLVATCSLHRDNTSKRQAIVDSCFYFLERGIIEPSTLRAIYSPNYYNYHPGDLAVVERILEILKRNMFGLSEAEHANLIATLEKRRKRVSVPWDTLDPPFRTPDIDRIWTNAKELVLPARDGDLEFNAVAVRGDELFVATIHHRGRKHGIAVELLRKRPEVSVSSPTTQDAWFSVGRILVSQQQFEEQIAHRRGPSNRSLMEPYFQRSLRPDNLVVDDRNAYLLTTASGILVFPLAGGEPYAITTTWGLPSNTIQQMVAVGNRVFAWVGDTLQATFVEIDINPKTVKTIASCQRKEVQTPLDDFLGAQCRMMMFWPDSSRILFIMDDGYEVRENRQQYSNRNGTWQYSLETGKITKYVVGGFLGSNYGRVSSHQFVVGRYDTKNKLRLWRMFDLTTDQFQELGVIDVPPHSTPFANFGGKLWWYTAHERITHHWDLTTKRLVPALAFPENQKDPSVIYGYSYKYGFAQLGENEVAIWGQTQIWLTSMNSLPASE